MAATCGNGYVFDKLLKKESVPAFSCSRSVPTVKPDEFFCRPPFSILVPATSVFFL